MAPQEDTLGNRHFLINKRTNETVQKNIPFADIENLPETCDADRLYKIDVAAKYKHLTYILDNLKSEDDLYVARALKKSAWLFTDQFAHVINPDNLENNLFPYMNSRAVAKMKLEIRLKLKDEKRSEEFYKYFLAKNLKEEALKWLPKCSVPFIEELILIEWKNIDEDLYQRLCKRTVKVFEVMIENRQHSYGIEKYFNSVLFLLNTHTDIFLNNFERSSENGSFYRLKFSKHSTKVILTKSRERFNSKPELYIRNIDLDELGKHFSGDELKEFLLQLYKIKSLKEWFSYDRIKPLIKKLPNVERFEFVKKIFIDKSVKTEDTDSDLSMVFMCPSARSKTLNMSNIYKFYSAAPFPLAFAEIKKMIRKESSAEERMEMFKVLISSAGRNADNIFLLVQHFRKNHINEPAKYKANFVTTLLRTTDGYLYEERTWKLLDEMLHSLEVYTNEDSLVSSTVIETIVSRCLLQKKSIPDLVLNIFMKNFSTLKYLQKHLDENNNDRVYNILRNQLKIELETLEENNKHKVMEITNKILNLIKDWNKSIIRDDELMGILKDLIKNNPNNVSLSAFYTTDKNWRRDLFEYSLNLVHTEDAYMNALKHKPDMILQHREELDQIIKSDSTNLTKILKKLRVYFPDTHGADLLKYYEDKLHQCKTENVGYKATTLGICILMHRARFNEIINEFVPKNYKIQWSEEDPALISIRKYLAQQMYHVRPGVEIETILLFAKDDYLQHALSSLLSISSRKSCEKSKNIIPQFITRGVSLQKHGIRLIFSKLNYKEIDKTYRELWNTTKNATIRAVIFNSTYELLCEEKSDCEIGWKLLKTFMEKITQEEDGSIYKTLTLVSNVPSSVRGEYCMIGFKILKSLPPKCNCESLKQELFNKMISNMEFMDKEFIEELIVEFVNEMFEKTEFINAVHKGFSTSYANLKGITQMIKEYILCCYDNGVQLKRYNAILKKIIDECMLMWNIVKDGSKVVKVFYENLVNDFINNTLPQLNNKFEVKYVIPKALFETLKNETKNLSEEENYILLTKIKLCLEYCDLYDAAKSELPREKNDVLLEEVFKNMSKDFGKRCINILEQDVKKHFPSINTIFAKILNDLMEVSHMKTIYGVLEYFTNDPTDIQSNLLALHIISISCGFGDADWKNFSKMILEKISKVDDKEIRLRYNILTNDRRDFY